MHRQPHIPLFSPPIRPSAHPPVHPSIHPTTTPHHAHIVIYHASTPEILIRIRHPPSISPCFTLPYHPIPFHTIHPTSYIHGTPVRLPVFVIPLALALTFPRERTRRYGIYGRSECACLTSGPRSAGERLGVGWGSVMCGFFVLLLRCIGLDWIAWFVCLCV
ncbi:hypothetical protein EJ05DRAFT_398509 [Pseudovirgaria hyperparasitica]|uniref:Uncharacterized protein n=1 Tax=Pseudovirgaria hyperparasitica TaxID=470096 RepID=A0A6A6W5A1_9PEZI|nr:uncharacterized protein EJ05DRAFT_398509 [Pseudovirgaria hyperparasitica]KAF2757725.1 hypothetical protein EJ05DRAFT_398509 [Pseudovirgaria hyperparasitica]